MRRKVRVVQTGIARRHDHDFNANFVREVIDELLQRDVALIDFDLLPRREALGLRSHRAHDDGVVLLALGLQRRQRLRHYPEREGEVDKGVFEILDLSGRQCDHLQELACDEAGDHGRCRRDGGDDLPGRHLDLMEVSLGNLVVPRAQVRSCGNEGHVEVRVVVLLELRRRHALRRGHLLSELRHFGDALPGPVVIVDATLLCCVLLVDLELHLLGLEGWHLDASRHLRDGRLVAVRRNAQVRGIQIRRGQDEL
mmetsp:Transcript_74974/g.147199  ORF Transcript_74974/g.147199 Transcript_74974/m.147199 type:complete len:254 (-) Transcript_74974:307-1068(-)